MTKKAKRPAAIHQTGTKKKRTTTKDGPTPPEHANLVEPKGSIKCFGCGYVYAGRANCPNCGIEAKGEQLDAYEKALKDAGLPPHRT